MSSSPDLRLAARAAALACALAALMAGAWAQSTPGIGRPATPAELKAWDIDVRSDLKGLPPGAGSVEKGMRVWEGKCASCHGVFGESNEVFNPIVGGTTRDDVKTGRVASLVDGNFPGRTTLMKLTQVSTLWDYINRAMPWTQPKTLTVEEVYAVTAYIMHLGEILPADFTLTHENMAQVQALLPNRDGMVTDHHLWPGQELPGRRAEPDVQVTACMQDCPVEPKVVSYLPDHARDAHGNLADQNRLVGPLRGVDTTQPPGTRPVRTATAAVATPDAAPRAVHAGASTALALARQYACTACHGMDSRLVGPSFKEIASRYAGRDDAVKYLSDKIRAGGQGVWGGIPMPAQTLPGQDAATIAQWLSDGVMP